MDLPRKQSAERNPQEVRPRGVEFPVAKLLASRRRYLRSAPHGECVATRASFGKREMAEQLAARCFFQPMSLGGQAPSTTKMSVGSDYDLIALQDAWDTRFGDSE